MSTIRYNEDYSKYEVILPDGTHLAAEDVPEEGVDWIDHPDKEGVRFFVVLSTCTDEDLEPNSLYELVDVPVEIEDGCDFEAEDEGDDDDDSDGGEPELAVEAGS